MWVFRAKRSIIGLLETVIGPKSEAWRVGPTPGQWRKTVVRSEPGLVSPYLVPLMPPGFRHQKELTVSQGEGVHTTYMPLSSPFPSRLGEGPSSSLDSGARNMGKEIVGRLEKGRLYPSDRVLRTHRSAAPILAHSAEKAESLLETVIGPKSEAWRVGPTPGQWRKTVVRSEPGLVSPYLVPLMIC